MDRTISWVATSATDIAQNAVALACQAAAGEKLPAKFSYEPMLIDRHNVAEFALTKLSAIADIPSRLVGVNRDHEAQRVVELLRDPEQRERRGGAGRRAVENNRGTIERVLELIEPLLAPASR